MAASGLAGRNVSASSALMLRRGVRRANPGAPLALNRGV
jgi:hypothetical protein